MSCRKYSNKTENSLEEAILTFSSAFKRKDFTQVHECSLLFKQNKNSFDYVFLKVLLKEL